jgi:death-on-curing protein
MIFLTKTEVLKIHRRTLSEQGGSEGVRDEGVLESALLAAENRAFYEDADVIACAAAYAFHLTQAHAFVDGNKRVAAVATEVFLLVNGFLLKETDAKLESFYLKIAGSEMTRDEVEQFLRERVQPLE